MSIEIRNVHKQFGDFTALNNVSLDHKEMDELRALFAGFLASAKKAIVNLVDEMIDVGSGKSIRISTDAGGDPMRMVEVSDLRAAIAADRARESQRMYDVGYARGGDAMRSECAADRARAVAEATRYTRPACSRERAANLITAYRDAIQGEYSRAGYDRASDALHPGKGGEGTAEQRAKLAEAADERAEAFVERGERLEDTSAIDVEFAEEH